MNKKIKKYIMLICVSAVSIVLIVLSISAAYTNVNKVKRVISTQGGGGTPFSSNYLNLRNSSDSSYDIKRISFSGSEKNFDITVSNFVHNNPSIINEHDITYRMIFTLVNASDNTTVITNNYDGFSVKIGEQAQTITNGVCTISDQTLGGKQSSTNTYDITVPKSFINTVNIKVEAVPDEQSYNYTDQKKLARIFTFSEYSERTTKWTGYFSETTVEGYDAFNYIITGQGKGTITLIWNPTQLEINKVFLDTNNIDESSTGNNKQMVFSVDSDKKSQYNIQFYKTANGTYTNIESLGVSCLFTPDATTTE